MTTGVFCCGFECGAATTGAAHWSTSGATPPTFDTTTVRSGARAGRCTPTAAQSFFEKTFISEANAVRVIRTYIRFATLPDVDVRLVSVTTGGAGALFKQSDSKIYAGYDDGTLNFGSTGVSVTTGVWYLLDIRADATANPWTIDVKVDGVDCAQMTRAVAAATFDALDLGMVQSGTADVYFDDLLLSNTANDYPIGAGYVNHFVPTSDGTHNVAGAADFKHGTAGADILNSTTDAWTLVDEVPLPTGTPSTTDLISLIAPPNATDYVEVKYGPASGISTPTTGPRLVEVINAIHQAGTGTGNMELRINDNGTTSVVYTATAVAGTTTFKYVRNDFATAPSTGAAWTSTLFNDLRLRFGSPAAVDANPDQYLDATMIEAEFAEVAVLFPLLPWPQPDGS